MAIFTHYTMEQRKIIADRIGEIFGIENAGMKIPQEGWRMEEGYGESGIRLRVEFIADITREQAEAILNATPLSSVSSEGSYGHVCKRADIIEGMTGADD